jgi:hypothetical protein
MAAEPIMFERRDGPTPNGGAYSTAQYSRTHVPCAKEDATEVEIIEYTADGQEIMQTYGTISPRANPAPPRVE